LWVKRYTYDKFAGVGFCRGTNTVDGLEPTEELGGYIEKEKKGELTMEDRGAFLDKKYKVKE